MKKKTLSQLITVMLLIVFTLTACSAPAPAPSTTPEPTPAAEQAPAAQKFDLKLGSNTAPTHPENQFARKLSELVKEKTNGNVIINVHDSATLGDHLERQEGLRLGTIDMTLTSIGYVGGYNPIFNIFEMPYLFKDEKHQNKVYQGEVGKMISEEAEKHGFVMISFLEMGARHLTNSKKPVVTPNDLKGLKIRVPETKSSMDALTAMGGTPTPMAFSELYMGLQQKQVDGQENPFSNIYASKFYEVQKYLSLTGHQRIEQICLFSKVNWEKLPKEYQEIILQSADEANVFVQGVIAKEESELKTKLKDAGMEINEVDQAAFMEKIKPLREQYVKEYGEQAGTYFTMIDEAGK